MVLFRIIFLQLFWLAIVIYGRTLNPVMQIFVALFVVYADYFVFRPQITLRRFSFLLLFFIIVGFLNDSSLSWFALINKNSYQFGNISLWIIFLAYYEHIFSKLKGLSNIKLSFIGGLAGAFTYYSAAKMGAIMILSEMENKFLLSQYIFWGIFFPLSLRLYFTKNFFDDVLDKTIFLSFDKSGFRRHQKKFVENLKERDLSQDTILITGATAGIGASAAASFSQLGACVYITGRNAKRGACFENENPDSKFVSLDMANWSDVYDFAKTCKVFTHVVFNAGSMPETLLKNNYEVEFQCASQLIGHYFLLSWLKEFKKLETGARIVWVSSGGMYLKKLELKSLFENSNYEKVETYANVKRAQVTLVEELSKKKEWNNFYLYSMHPGWVGTEGLKEALPKFYLLMKNRLRSPEEGADTILWCILASEAPVSGGFYFDRKLVSPYISEKYSPTTVQRNDLIKTLDKFLSRFLSKKSY